MAKPLLRHEAQLLRKDGFSITSIAKRLDVSKSTVSMWCRDISLTERQIQRIAEQSKHHATLVLLRAAEIQRKKRHDRVQEALREGAKDVNHFSRRDQHMVGLGLYWGEGYKKGSQEFGFTNSDPLLIRFYIGWLKNIFNITTERLILRVSINENHKHREDEVSKYWSKATGVPLNQFTKTSFIKSVTKKKYGNDSKHYGTLRIKVRKGTQLRRRVLGSLQKLAS